MNITYFTSTGAIQEINRELRREKLPALTRAQFYRLRALYHQVHPSAPDRKRHIIYDEATRRFLYYLARVQLLTHKVSLTEFLVKRMFSELKQPFSVSFPTYSSINTFITNHAEQTQARA